MQVNGPNNLAALINGQQQEAQIASAVSQVPREAEQQAQETQVQSEIANPVQPVTNVEETDKARNSFDTSRGSVVNILA